MSYRIRGFLTALLIAALLLAWAPPAMASGGKAIQISAGHETAYVLREDGTVWAWGANAYGQVGDGTTTYRSAPVQVSGLSDIIAIAAGDYHCLALRQDHTVWAWGNNTCGELGDGTTVSKRTPVQVSGLTDVKSIAAGYGTSMAIKTDNSLWVWGDGDSGRLGTYSAAGKNPTPLHVPTPSSVTAVEGGEWHTLLLSYGSVWATGWNGDGQLGDGGDHRHYARVPQQTLPKLNNIIAVAAGSQHSLALDSSGTLYAWGSAGMGALGNGSTSFDVDYAWDVETISDVIGIAAGSKHSLVIKSDHTVWSAGWNAWGQAGQPAGRNTSTFRQVEGLSNIVQVAGGYDVSLALDADGNVWIFGWGSYSPQEVQLPGISLTAPVMHPVTIIGTSAILSWEPVAGADSYHVYQGGTLVGTVEDTDFTLTNLVPGSSAVYSVCAASEDLGEGPASDVLVSIPDETPEEPGDEPSAPSAPKKWSGKGILCYTQYGFFIHGSE